FTLSEWDGFVAFSEFISNAIQSIPNFIEKVFTYFQDLPRQQLERSMLVGAIVGAVSTALVYLSAKDFLKLPTFDTGAVLISIFTGIFIYYSPINPPILNTLVLAGLVFGLSAYAFNEMDALSLSPPYTIPRALWVSLLALAFSLA